MKVERKNDFVPVTLILETQKDVDRLFAVFNHVKLWDALEMDVEYEDNFNPLEGFSANVSYYHERIKAAFGQESKD